MLISPALSVRQGEFETWQHCLERLLMSKQYLEENQFNGYGKLSEYADSAEIPSSTDHKMLKTELH